MAQNHQNHPFFGHLFESKGTFYYYEPSSQEIIALDPVLAAVLPNYEQCHKGEIPSELRTFFHPGEVREAMLAIEEAENTDDLFSRKRPLLISAAKPNDTGSTEYATNLQHLVLTLTENCNLRCRYCLHGADLNWVRSHGNKTMSKETALKAARYFLERCCTDEIPAVSFYGGEALLQAGLMAAVVQEVRTHPRGAEAHLVIDTNGVLLDAVTLELVIRNKMHLQISLDGPREYHDRQ